MTLRLVATTTRGAEGVLADELRALGAAAIQVGKGAVRFRGDHACAYRACLRLRTASRVLLVLRRFPAPDARALYGGVRTLPWTDHLGPGHTLRVDFVGTSASIRNTRFGALKVKDAVVDAVRQASGARPSVSLDDPDLRIHVHLRGGHAQVALDLSGPLHVRGHGRDGGPAPLKETLAAAILSLAGWPAAAAAGQPLVDPLCGSGTLLVEAAEMALGLAAGRGRDFGFARWRGHRDAAWRSVRDEPDRPIAPEVCVVGSDRDPAQVRRARDNARRSGVEIRLSVADLRDVRPPPGPTGLVVTNPPYGERLGSDDEGARTVRLLGDVLRNRFLGWSAWVFVGSARQGRHLGLRPDVRHALHNGPLDARLLGVPIADTAPAGPPRWRA